jgi:hypothetical protein
VDEGEHEAGVLPGGSASDPDSLEEENAVFWEGLHEVKRCGQAGVAPADDQDVGGVFAAERS